MDVGFLPFYSHAKSFNSVDLTMSSEGIILSRAKDISSRT